MKLVFAKPAERDLKSIIDYIAMDNPVAAEKTYRRGRGAIANLSTDGQTRLRARYARVFRAFITLSCHL